MSTVGSLFDANSELPRSWASPIGDRLAELRRDGFDFDTAWRVATAGTTPGAGTAPDEPPLLEFARQRFELGYYRAASVSIPAHRIPDSEWDAGEEAA